MFCVRKIACKDKLGELYGWFMLCPLPTHTHTEELDVWDESASFESRLYLGSNDLDLISTEYKMCQEKKPLVFLIY